jgi:2-keto-4-pentenoate hydratase/2-oxohepta-3-ene-1,7-dioic acid hydratase in catechol pathway
MKFLTLEQGQLGALLEDTVIDLAAAARELNESEMATTLLALIQAGDQAAHEHWQLAQIALDRAIACRNAAEVTPQAPLPQPLRNLFCLGKNYREHAKEIAAKIPTAVAEPEHPIFFTKATTTVIGPGQAIPNHKGITNKLDYEAELAVIIGKGGKDIPRQEAMDHIFGYTIVNDVSARDLQGRHIQWFRGKSLDGFAPMGPVVAHHSAMPPMEAVEIQCWVNGELRQQAKASDMIFDIPAIIETLSAGMSLLPGDIIATGTPAGVGMGFEPPRYLQPGDEVRMEISGIGTLCNRVSS